LAVVSKLSGAAETGSGDLGSFGPTVEISLRVGACAPTKFGSKDGENRKAPDGVGLGSIAGDRGQRSLVGPDAGAGISGTRLIVGAKPGIGAATVGAFVLSGVDVGAVVEPAMGAWLVI